MIADLEVRHRRSQKERVLDLLREQGRLGVTPELARIEVGTTRLAARISDLKADGHDIEMTLVRVGYGARVARYTLIEARPERGFWT